ncbi:hypothetical protein DFH06DRAFT_1297883 [Mycena polygramma]|nr:hypothetical protein DFH06DRAFT_1297883 [Mycena polygramma]
MSSELPPELWSQIFIECSRTNLMSVHAVSRLFRDICRTVLFAECKLTSQSVSRIFDDEEYGLDIDRYAEKLAHELRQLGPETRAFQKGILLRRELERWQFWSSPEIAPLVLRCVLHSDKRHASPALAVLSKFTNLQELTIDTLQFPWAVFRCCAIPSLNRLCIRLASAELLTPSTFLPTKIKARHVSYTNMPPRNSDNANSYLSILDPSLLRSLEYTLDSWHCGPFPPMLTHQDWPTMAEFHNLEAVKLTVGHTTFTEIQDSLSAFPAVRELTVWVHGRCTTSPVPPTALAPHLRSYTGPCVLLPIVLAHATPTHITIDTGTSNFAPQLLSVLRSIGSTHESVRSLLVSIKYGDLYPVLADTLEFFPGLRSLTLHIYVANRCPNPVPAQAESPESLSVFERLTHIPSVSLALGIVVLDWWRGDRRPNVSERLTHILTVPHALESVVINWWRGNHEPDEEDDEPTGLGPLKAALLRNISSLKRVSFGGQVKGNRTAFLPAHNI